MVDSRWSILLCFVLKTWCTKEAFHAFLTVSKRFCSTFWLLNFDSISHYWHTKPSVSQQVTPCNSKHSETHKSNNTLLTFPSFFARFCLLRMSCNKNIYAFSPPFDTWYEAQIANSWILMTSWDKKKETFIFMLDKHKLTIFLLYTRS